MVTPNNILQHGMENNLFKSAGYLHVSEVIISPYR